jgi:ribosomal 50S subunit-recycling heat shock protein
MEMTRVDRWLWAVRLYKTRSDATAACRGGHVRINGVRVLEADIQANGSVVHELGDVVGRLEREQEAREKAQKNGHLRGDWRPGEEKEEPDG